jgi:hypothetical protein
MASPLRVNIQERTLGIERGLCFKLALVAVAPRVDDTGTGLAEETCGQSHVPSPYREGFL